MTKDIAPVFCYNNIMKVKDFSEKLYKLYGPVTRARGCFLYTKKGVRITDLYQENGRAILGWDGGSSFTHLKNVLSRGQVGSFICEDYSKLNKSINILFNSERKLFFFSDKISAIKAAIDFSPNSTILFKPWSIEKEKISSIESIIYEPTLPWTDTIFILAVKLQNYTQKSILNEKLNEKLIFYKDLSINIPYALQVAITRGTYNLIEAEKNRKEKDWFIYDTIITKYWQRNGPYLQPKIPKEKYEDFVIHCLKLGLAINPDYNECSIIPFGADKGVFTSLKNSPFIY